MEGALLLHLAEGNGLFHQAWGGGIEWRMVLEVMVSGGESRHGSLCLLVEGVEAEELFLLVVAGEVNAAWEPGARGRRWFHSVGVERPKRS